MRNHGDRIRDRLIKDVCPEKSSIRKSGGVRIRQLIQTLESSTEKRKEKNRLHMKNDIGLCQIRQKKENLIKGHSKSSLRRECRESSRILQCSFHRGYMIQCQLRVL